MSASTSPDTNYKQILERSVAPFFSTYKYIMNFIVYQELPVNIEYVMFSIYKEIVWLYMPLTGPAFWKSSANLERRSK